MNFTSALRVKLSQYNVPFDNFSVEDFLIKILDENDNWFEGVANGILCVESDGTYNLDRVKGSDTSIQFFRKKPLKGLKKVHIRLPIHSSLLKNLGIDVEMNADFDNPQIIENDPVKLEIAYKQLTNVVYDESLGREVTEIGQKMKNKNENNKNNGCWLIYGNGENKRYYLMLHTDTDHTPDGDQEIYNKLIKVYPESFLKKIQQEI